MAERISIEGVSKVYPGGNTALKGVSLDVEPGAFLVLLGPSGSGKTTLLRSLAGIERITSGRITVGGATMADQRTHVPPDRRGLSMVFQDYALWPHLTVHDNVAFALRRLRLPRETARERTQRMLGRVGLGSLSGRYPNELSGGEQQRVSLARALVADTGLILCDEPLSNLDADLRERMRVEISSLVREAGATTIYITHDQAEAFALADQVGVLEQGRLVQHGTPEEIYTQPATPFVARFTGLSGELPVRVRATGPDGTAEVGPAGQPGARPFLARAAGRPIPGTAARVMIRPTGVQLCRHPGDEHHLTGDVIDVAFRGRGYELVIDLPGLGRLAGVFARRRHARGERVRLRLDPAGCHLFGPADGADVDSADMAGAGAAGAGAAGTGTGPAERASVPALAERSGEQAALAESGAAPPGPESG